MQEEMIVALYRSRDERAVRETDALYGARLRALSRRITGSTEDAEECVSDAYLAAWNSIPPQRPDDLFAYLAQICRRASFAVLDRRGAKKRSAAVVELTAELESCIPDRRGQQTVSTETLTALLEAFLRRQSAENRRLFLRRYWYGESIREIARASVLSENAVKLRLLRLREGLREELEKEDIL